MGSIRQKDERLYILSGENILLLDAANGEDQHITIPELTKADNTETKHTLNESKSITSLEFTKCGQYIAVATENKWVIVYDRNFKIIKSFMINRTASKVYFTPNNDILVADKTGDVYLYEENTDGNGILLLGHRSVILDLIMSNCGKYIITCDRDEKIRISHYPNCYNIASYCLGHSEFVTKIIMWNDNILVSASGDGTVRFWYFIEGKEISLLDTNAYINDKEILEKFASRFEKIEISALPVSDLDIYKTNENYLAVSICGCDLIQLYKVNSENLSCEYLTNFSINQPFRFCLSNNIYIFTHNLLAFSYLSSDFVNLNLKCLENFNEKYKSIMKSSDDNSINLLYKRKFDNVQEYLERKKQRTEIK